MENNYTVYMHISPSNKRYIGITSMKPKRRWNNGKGYEHNKYFTRAINKYGWDNFEHIIIVRGLDEETAKWLEIELIREWDTTNINKGYNLSHGGESHNGCKHTEEFKQNLSKRFSGKKRPEHSKKMKGENNPNYNKPMSDEQKEKLRNAQLGKHHSEETKKKMKESHKNRDTKGKNNPSAKKVICLETLEIFDCITDAANWLGRSRDTLYRALGKNKKCKNYTFMYYKDYLKMNGECNDEL